MHLSESVSRQAEELKHRTRRFAIDVIRFVRLMPQTDEGRTIARQLLRSCTGVASNYRRACRSRSRQEFIARIGIALEEADESALWFEILIELTIVDIAVTAAHLQEANELSAIFAKSRLTARARQNGTEPSARSQSSI